MRVIVTLIWLIVMVWGQQLATLTQPPSLQTSVFQIISTNQTNSTFTTTVTFMQNYSIQPAVFVSLVTISQFTGLSLSNLQQSLITVKSTYFTHFTNVTMAVQGITYRFTKLEVIYLAYDFYAYQFLQLHQSFVPIPTTSLANIYLKIGYIGTIDSTNTSNTNTTGTNTSNTNTTSTNSTNSTTNTTISPALDSSHKYSLNVLLSGFNNLQLLGYPSLYIDAVLYDENNYLLNVKAKRLSVSQLQILRILIDVTQMQRTITGPSSLVCTSGTIVHLSDPNSIENNGSPEFLPFAMLYGIKGWEGRSIQLTSFIYLFNNTSPRSQVNIGYILFQTSSCPANQLYVASQSLCYGLSAAFYYQLTPQTMAPCPAECYTCVGPLSSQCKSCVPGWNRYYVAGRCLCKSGFYSAGGPICKNCTEAMAGCYTCSSATNCLTCLPGCNAINFNPIYCDCPNHVQANYSFNCPTSYYYQYDKNQCKCLPQTFEYRSGICFPCDVSCYICVRTNKYCLVCINGFTLINNSCIFFSRNYALLGQGVSLSSPYNRCIKWDASRTSCVLKCKRYYYNSNCYGVCPLGTFKVTSPGLTCQPCKLNCRMCFNFTVCLQCQPNYFYFNSTTFACSSCSAFCATCLSASYCTSCQANYNLINNQCLRTSLASLNCSKNCAFCLVTNWCLACDPTYYLNTTDYTCYLCNNNQHFGISASGSCIQICGDGVVEFAECDDGNLISGDGCNSNCTIQKGFFCRLIDQKSYCWNKQISISWDIIPVFGANRFTLLVKSSISLTSSILSLACSFNHDIVQNTTSNLTAKWVIDYNQTILMTQNKDDEQNIKNLDGFDTDNRCFLDINGLVNYTIIVNASPELMFINYSDSLQSYTQNSLLQSMCEVGLLTMLSIGILGLMPMNIFAGLRVFLLALSTYLDYYKLPINSFKTVGALMNLFLMRNTGDSSTVITFDSDYYFELLWKLAAIYAGIFLLHEWVLRGFYKFCSSMDWETLTKIAAHILDNKVLIYQSIYTSYQVVILTLLANAFRHFSQLDAKLVVFMTAHMVFFCLCKAHFYFTLHILFQKNYAIRYILISDQLQNITIAFLATLSNTHVSYTPITITLFAFYNLYSLINFSDKSQRKDEAASQFKVTNNIAVWQYGGNLLLIMSMQILKCSNMWRGVADLSVQDYQSLGSLFGIIISFTVMGTIMLNFLIMVPSILIRMCEVKVQNKDVSEVATVENLSAQASAIQ